MQCGLVGFHQRATASRSDRSQDTQKVDREKTYAILQWLNRNRRMLLNYYKNQSSLL